jgi:hypothetical protein
MMELENWEEIIDNRTILAGDFNTHNPRWGNNKQKDSDHIISIIDKYNGTIHNNFEYTRHGNDNQQPSIIDLTLSAGQTVNNWLILNDDEHHTRSDHRAISWETQEESEKENQKEEIRGKKKNKNKEETNHLKTGWKIEEMEEETWEKAKEYYLQKT